MAEPTSTFTFSDLVLEAALEAGTAYFGATGNSAPAIPEDAADLADAKRHVNNAIRQFILDAPSNGWYWMNKVADLVLWASVASETTTVTGGAYDSGNDQTTLTAAASVFHPAMELHDIVIDGVGTFEMKSYTSATVMVVTGDASTASADDFTITADGNYSMPLTFGGDYTGKPTYAADTNQSVDLRWVDEGTIRDLREDNVERDNPRLLAPRPHPSTARRWEVLAWPVPSSDVTVQFPYDMEFTLLTDAGDVTADESLPTPRYADEAVRAVVKAVVERDVHREAGIHTDYYLNVALPRAQTRDGRARPKNIGKFGNPTRPALNAWNFRDFRDRPTVDTSDLNI